MRRVTDIVGNETLRSLWTGLVDSCGDRTFLIFQDREGATCEFSYSAFDQEINRTANLFLTLGIEAGERVAVQMHTCPEFMMCLFGLAKIGAVMVPMNEQYLAEEAAFVLERTGASCAVVEADFVGLYDGLADEQGYLAKGVFVARGSADAEAGLPSSVPVRCFDKARACEPTVLREERPLASNDPVEIIFTSCPT